MADKSFKRLYIFAGHYGSGKTNIAVNFALHMKKCGMAVRIADMDIVNPYFRTKDSLHVLEEAGIQLISPAFANTNVDLPALPAEMYGVIQNKEISGVLDVGGDDRGAYALGRYAPSIIEENNFEMCYVVNFHRPLTRKSEDALEVMREIEAACGIKFTAIVNNSNLGPDTTAETVESSFGEARRLSELSALPVIFTCIPDFLEGKVRGDNIFPLTLQEKYFDIIS